jgi:hypothetical protein
MTGSSSTSGSDDETAIRAHIAGVYSPIGLVILAGFMLHVLTATSIGIIAGIFLYKTNILNISKPSNGLKYGLLVGTLVFFIFAILA